MNTRLSTDSEFPFFLQSYGNLKDHIDSQLSELSSTEKGRIFSELSSRLMLLSSIGQNYDYPKQNEKLTHDDGVDFFATSLEGGNLYCQAKFTIPSVKEFDSIISKFHDYYRKLSSQYSDIHQGSIFELIGTHEDQSLFPGGQDQNPLFMIVTLSNITRNIVPKYLNSSYASKDFFLALKKLGGIEIIDGPEILNLLKTAYTKAFELPSNLDISFTTKPIHQDNVYIGVVTGLELKKHYDKFGDSIFLENIRDFLGFDKGDRKGRASVNNAILDTVNSEPGKMLSRNNGITFKAESVSAAESKSCLTLKKASIVNGCQTTMALVKNASSNASVLVKIVETKDSWDIAKSANFQNEVKQIELDLARYIRPQTIKKAVTEHGIGLSLDQGSPNSILDALNVVYKDQVAYNQAYALFIGFFSKNVSNVLRPNYTELRNNILNEFTFEDPDGQKTYQFLIDLMVTSEKARKRILNLKSKTSDNLLLEFQRFFADENTRYHSIITVLASCCSVRKNIYDQRMVSKFGDLSVFFNDVSIVISNNEEEYIKAYVEGFKTVMQCIVATNKDIIEIKKDMNSLMRSLKFANVYSMVLSALDMMGV
ncbi:MAG: AIPR family protein [Nodosilinea sp.]